MADKVDMVALLTIPKRGMKAGKPYKTDKQTSLDDIQMGRGKRPADAAPATPAGKGAPAQ